MSIEETQDVVESNFDARGRFAAGNKLGNGRAKHPEDYRQLQQVMKEHSPRAIARLVELMESVNDKTALTACKEVITRAYGKAPENIEVNGSVEFNHTLVGLLQSMKSIDSNVEVIEHQPVSNEQVEAE